jgi:DNA polymerase-3 subunit delta'
MDYFSGIVGQDKPIKLIKKSIASAHTSHAYLFSGPAGVGKMQVAMAFAHSLIALADEQAGVYFNEKMHPDLLIIEKMENRSLIAKEQISRQLEPWLALKPYRAQHRVAIIRDAHLMSLEAANALLKTLEEPPAYALIILICDDGNILETIISRCQSVRFFPVAEKDLVEFLQARGFDREKASRAARLGQGSVAGALRFVEEEGLEEIWETATGIIKDMAQGNRAAIFEAAEKLQSAPDLIIRIVETILRDALVIGEKNQDLLLAPEAPEIIGLLQSKDPGRLMTAIMEIEKLKTYYRRNVNTLLLNTSIGYQLWHALQ